MPVRAKLSRRHSESLPKLLAKIILGIEAAPARDLGDAKIPGLEKPRGFLETLLFEEMAQKASGHAMKAAGNVLPGVAKLLRDGLHGDFLVIADSSADTLNE